jgi:membrane peptidoglycan carboxypeptidase
MVSSALPRSGRRLGVVQVIALLLSFVLMAGLGGVLAAGLVMPAVATTSVITDTSVRLFDDLPSELETVPLSEKSTILASDGVTVLAEFWFQNRIVVTLDQISQPMRDAVIAVEDRRFYEHGGIDPQGLLRAFFENATTEGGTQGGSTLTQQYVKNALIQNALQGEDTEEIAAAIEAATVSSGTEGYARKLAEAKISIALEQRLTKDEILERYLNIAQFGLSVYGVEAAALHFFSVHAADLNYIQAATIAGITRAPGDYDPERDPEAAQGRRDTVLGLMRDQGKITEAEYQAGIATPLVDTLVIGQRAEGCMAANAVANAGYFCDYVTKIIANDPVFGEEKDDRARLLYRGGLTIITTLDVGLQQMADEEVKNGIPVLDPSGVASAISVIQPGTGNVLALAQNRIYNNTQTIAAGETAVNYNTDNLYGSASGFPPGSTFKPFTLLQWFKSGHSLGEMVDGTARTRNENEFVTCGARGPNRPWKLGNSEGGKGVMSVLDATRNSVNNAYADIAAELDLCDIMNGAAEIGVHTGAGNPPSANPANVIGTDSIAPLTMAAAFASFASGGVYCDPVAILSVVDHDGQSLPVPAANCRQAIAPDIAAAMNYTLSQVWSGTGRSIGPIADGRPSAGKTGTTSENEHTWFVGYTPQIATAVWVGFPDSMTPVQNITINGRYYRNVYGSSIAGPTWRRFMERAHAGREVAGFAAPPQSFLTAPRVSLPQVGGRSVDEAIRVLEEAGLRARVGESRESGHAAGLVAWTDPAAGTQLTVGSSVTLIISTGPPPVVIEPPDPGPGPGPEPDPNPGPNGG